MFALKKNAGWAGDYWVSRCSTAVQGILSPRARGKRKEHKSSLQIMHACARRDSLPTFLFLVFSPFSFFVFYFHCLGLCVFFVVLRGFCVCFCDQVRGLNRNAYAFLVGTKYDLYTSMPPEEQRDIDKQVNSVVIRRYWYAIHPRNLDPVSYTHLTLPTKA